jgi:hypothetical protein
LKAIADNRNISRLSFFLAFLDGIRRQIFPEISDAFQRFVESEDWAFIDDARIAGYRKTAGMQAEIISLWRTKKGITAVTEYIRNTFQRPSVGKK